MVDKVVNVNNVVNSTMPSSKGRRIHHELGNRVSFVPGCERAQAGVLPAEHESLHHVHSAACICVSIIKLCNSTAKRQIKKSKFVSAVQINQVACVASSCCGCSSYIGSGIVAPCLSSKPDISDVEWAFVICIKL